MDTDTKIPYVVIEKLPRKPRKQSTSPRKPRSPGQFQVFMGNGPEAVSSHYKAENAVARAQEQANASGEPSSVKTRSGEILAVMQPAPKLPASPAPEVCQTPIQGPTEPTTEPQTTL